MICLLFGNNRKWPQDPKDYPDAIIDHIKSDPRFSIGVDYSIAEFWQDTDHQKIQVHTTEGLQHGPERVQAPPQLKPFAKAQRGKKPQKQQEML